MLTPDLITNARYKLGEMWGLGRPLSHRELGECLELRTPEHARDFERGHGAITGPVSVAILGMLAGYLPPTAPPEAWDAKDARARVAGVSGE